MASYDFSAPRLFIEVDLQAGSTVPLDRSQQNYIRNVLRLKEGSRIQIFNGRDGEWQAVLQDGASRKSSALLVQSKSREQTAPCDLHYLFAPLKHARLDYMIQKAVEMGAGILRPVMTRRCQVARVNAERMVANAIEAAEQCGILAVPRIDALCDLDTVLAGWEPSRTLVFCDEDADEDDAVAALRGANVARLGLLIGPEGGFDAAEREDLLSRPYVVRLSLGPRILRADTAAVAALALIQAIVGDWRPPHHDLARL